MVLYHATDLEAAKAIQKGCFSCRTNKEHWLGNGIYFYQDYSLAEWWATNPTNKFGTTISTPAIITCEVDDLKHRSLNLLKLKDYKLFCKSFNDEFLPLYIKNQDEHEIPDWKQVRCAFCDFMASLHRYDIIIGNFNKQDQPYLPDSFNSLFKTFLLNYTEVQVCIFDSRIIHINDIHKV